MRNAVLAVGVLSLFTFGCGTTQSSSGLGAAKVKIPDPEVKVAQISSVPTAAQHVTGGLSVQFRVAVTNHATHAITLRQLTLLSMGFGGYTLDAGSRPFDMTVQPEATEAVDFWLPARIDEASLVGANGPVTLRVTAAFDSPVGQFQRVTVQQVNSRTDITGNQ